MNYIFLAQSTFLVHFPRSIYSIQLYPETDNPFTSSSLILVWSGQSDKLWIDVNWSLMNDQDRIICLNPPVFLKCNQYFMQEWQRKEQLYGQIIALFDKSKLWEYAVPLCKELCDLYENRCGIKIFLRNSSKKSTLLTSLWPWKLLEVGLNFWFFLGFTITTNWATYWLFNPQPFKIFSQRSDLTQSILKWVSSEALIHCLCGTKNLSIEDWTLKRFQILPIGSVLSFQRQTWLLR